MTQISVQAIQSVVLLLSYILDICSFTFILLKLYRTLCYTQIIFEMLPLYNPYYWPLNTLRVLTRPYFRFWRKVLPPVIIAGRGFDVSVFVSFEVLELLFVLLSTFKYFIQLEIYRLLLKLP